MSSQRMLILVLAGTLGLAACATAPHREVAFDACVAGETCTVSGKLELHAGQPAWAALLVSGKQCAKLALPDDFYREADRWNESEISVTGRAFKQPAADENGGMVTLWYTEKERRLAMGMCDGGVGLYVNTMRGSNGRFWPASSSPK